MTDDVSLQSLLDRIINLENKVKDLEEENEWNKVDIEHLKDDIRDFDRHIRRY